MSKVTRRKKKISPPMLLGHVLRRAIASNLWTLALATACLASAFSLVVLSHEQRQLFAELEQLEQERDALDVERRNLSIELRTAAGHSRLEKAATNNLGMKNLDTKSERLVKRVEDSD